MELRLIAPRTPDAAAAEALNQRAFPDNERVSLDYMFAAPGADVLGAYEGATLCGFAVVRREGRLAYLCFFAVEEAMRCRGIGGSTLQLLRLHYPGCQLVVDYEAPDGTADNNPQRMRRRAFYLRNGLIPTGWYAYYSQTEFEIACSEAAFDIAGFRAMYDRLHAAYPDFDPKLYRK